MKKLGVLGLVIVLTGCASINYSELEWSNATLSNVEIKEVHELKKREHKIHISFNYSIAGFHAEHKLYYCTVQFLNLDGSSQTSFNGREFPCQLEQSKGSISVTWPSPLDKSLKVSKEKFSEIKYPIEYFVAIHQRTGQYDSQIIGKSDLNVSSIKI